MEIKKKTDDALFQLLSEKITNGDYFFTNHAEQRLFNVNYWKLKYWIFSKEGPGKREDAIKERKNISLIVMAGTIALKEFLLIKIKLELFFRF